MKNSIYDAARLTMLLLLFGISAVFFVGCAGTALPGRIYALPAGRTLQFHIVTSRGNGKMDAFDPKTGEKFEGEYSAFFKGQGGVVGNVGGQNVLLVKPPTGANANGILIGDKGTTITLYFEIKPGLRPTGYGSGADKNGNPYEVYF